MSRIAGGVVTRPRECVGSRIRFDSARIADFADRHGIRRLAFFGSVLREDFRPESDVDVLVEFQPGAHVGWAIVSIADELSRLLGRKVDLRTPAEISRHFAQDVLDSAEVFYEQA